MSAPRRFVVILNASSGGGNDHALVDRLAAFFSKADPRADSTIRLVHGAGEIAEALKTAIGERPSAIVAAGGDGTVSAVVAAIVDTDIALGVLPLGTLNHFAKDLGLPLELEAAVDRLLSGASRRVDVGEVNGRIFVNNSSLGLYPDIVQDRERQQKRLGRSKWLAFVFACLGALRRYPFLGVRLSVDGSERIYRTPFVFIGNNDYRMDGLALGQRECMDGGVLSLYVGHRPGRLRLVQLAFRALVGRLRQARDFDALQATEIVIDSRHRKLRVATDGEVSMMTLPLRYRIRPSALEVLGAAIVTSSP